MVSLPEGAGPQTVDSFDHAVALWLTGWNEDQFHSKVERDSHKLPENTRLDAKSCKSRVIIYLQEIYQTQLSEALQKMRERQPSQSCLFQCFDSARASAYQLCEKQKPSHRL